MISQIIELCPKKINLYCIDNISTSAMDIIYYLFDKKINLITWFYSWEYIICDIQLRQLNILD